MKKKWSVLVVHEDTEARQIASGFCDALVKRFWRGTDFDVGWTSFGELESAAGSNSAMPRAASANCIVFAVGSGAELPLQVRAWVELWVRERHDREGVLAGVCGSAKTSLETQDQFHHYLRGVAHRSGMDYVTQVPQSISHPIPQSLESYTERAEQVTNVLEEILHHRLPPPNSPA